MNRVLAVLVTAFVTGAQGCAAASAARPVSTDRDIVSRLHAARFSDSLSAILLAGVRDSAFPGAVAIVGTRTGAAITASVGTLDWGGSSKPDPSTLWDLASLTKVVGLTSAMMLLVESGAVDLESPVQRYLPEFTGKWKERVTVKHLLTHSSGLPSWRPLYKETESPRSAMSVTIGTPLDTLPGTRMVYSDLGVILLGELVTRVSGQPLDEFLASRVFGPLGMRETMYRPSASLRDRIAPTEVDPWRQRHLRGEVHDENAFALGGVSGHAGLFSSARDLVRLARLYLDGGTLEGHRFVSPATIARFTSLQDSALSHRALGWEKPNGSNSAGRLMSARAFGHTGFTGTSMWIDPERGVFVLLLSNRVNPTREHRGITQVRVAVADAAMRAVLSATQR